MYKIIGGDGKEYGPVTFEEVQRWIAEKRLKASSLIQKEGSTNWVAVSTLIEFASLFNNVKDPARPPPFSTSEQRIDSQLFTESVLKSQWSVDAVSCLSRSWKLIFGNPWEFIAAFLITYLCLGFLGALPCGIGSLCQTLLIGVFTAGLYLFYLRKIRKENSNIADVFIGFEKSRTELMLGSLVVSLVTLKALLIWGTPLFYSYYFPTLQTKINLENWQNVLSILFPFFVGSSLLMFISFFLNIIWIFTFPLIIDKDIPFWQAMELSRKVVFKKFINILVLVMISDIISASGILFCCVGAIFTYPIGIGMLMYAYEDIFGSKIHADS
jgi:uncharacterized membrane protein